VAKTATATFLDDSVVAEQTALTVPESETITDITTRAYRQDTPELDREDLNIPRMRIAQQMSTEVSQHHTAEMGDLLVTGHPSVKSVTFIIIGSTKAREYRDEDDVLCQSPDGKRGYGNPGIVCADCKLKEWGWNESKQKGVPPPCTQIYSFLVYSLEHDMVLTVDFKRTSLNEGKQLNSLLVSRGGYGKFAVKMSTTIKTGKNTYAVPTVMLDVSVTPEQVAETMQAVRERFGFGS